jgi:hypothetical protein
MMGKRIADAIREALSSADHVLLVGLANEYMSYFCTEEEYALQHYEGSSTMYGPRAGSRIRDDLAALAKDLDGNGLRKKQRRYRYVTGPGESFGVKQFDLLSHRDRLISTYYTLANVLMVEGQSMPVPNYPRFIWIDKNPKWPDDPDESKMVIPSVTIEVKKEGNWIPLEINGVPETDEGVNFVTVVVASFLGKSRWLTIWMPPGDKKDDPLFRTLEFRFAVQGTSGIFRSPSFTLAAIRDHWGLTGIARKPEVTDAGKPDKQ